MRDFAAKPSVTALVPLCASCPGYCCKNDLIMLHPECGDDPAAFDCVPTKNPFTGADGFALKHKPNGDCAHLGPNGCEIYEARPVICREYDCGRQYAQTPRAMRKAMIARGFASKPQFDQGRRVQLARQRGEG